MANDVLASGPALSLKAWVDALLSGRSDARVLLVQQNQKNATLLWDEQVVILLDYRGQIIGEEVIGRIDEALAAEDESVIDGITGSLMIVLWGRQPNSEQSLPDQHPKGWPLVWLSAVPDDSICVFSKEELPADAPSIVDWLNTAQRRAQKGEGGLSDTRRTNLERAGEDALGAQGILVNLFEPGRIFLGMSPPVIAWTLVIVLYYVFGGYSDTTSTLVRMGAISDAYLKLDGGVRVITAGLLHVGIIHYAANVVGLIMLGTLPLSILGPGRFSALLTVGSASGFMLALAFGDHTIHCGASGGVWALLGMMIASVIRRERFVSRGLAAVFVSMAVGNVIIGFASSLKEGVSLLGHLGGAIGGFLITITGILTAGITEHSIARESRRLRRIDNLVLVVVSILWLSSLGFLWRQYQPWSVRWPAADRDEVLIAGEMTMRIPQTIVGRKAEQYNDDTRAWFFGQPERDALLISIKVSPKHDHQAPLITDDDVQWKTREPYRHGAGEGQKGSGELLSNGQPCHQWVWTENDKIIVVQVLVAPWAYDRWKFKATEIADGVRMMSTQH